MSISTDVVAKASGSKFNHRSGWGLNPGLPTVLHVTTYTRTELNTVIVIVFIISTFL